MAKIDLILCDILHAKVVADHVECNGQIQATALL